jgi:hypothetical protein
MSFFGSEPTIRVIPDTSTSPGPFGHDIILVPGPVVPLVKLPCNHLMCNDCWQFKK